MVIGQDVESPDRNGAAEPMRPSCRALSNLPQIRSPGVVVQRVMNLVMPLRPPDPDRGETSPAMVKAKLVMAMGLQRDAITTGLDNLGTIHFARFNIVGNALHLLSVYDGTVQGYVQEFAVQIGDAFDTIMSFVADWPPPSCAGDAEEADDVSVRDHPAEFVEWVIAHDITQFQRDPTNALVQTLPPALAGADGDKSGGGATTKVPPLTRLTMAALVKQFENEPDAHLSIHRGYPGQSVAQIRQALEVGW